jgi:NADH-quinone oxidoreductase B subunit
VDSKDKVEVPISAEAIAKTKHGGVIATSLLDLEGLMDKVRGQIQKLLPNVAKDVIAAAQANSIWMLTFGLACCAIEMMATGTADYDLDRLGIIPRASPRQADLMIIAGTLPIQMGDQTLRVWEQMPEPKYSIAMGVCATDGGPYTLYGYSVLPGADRKIPVNVYVTGCPPRPEALLNSLIFLRQMVAKREVHASQVLLDKDGRAFRHHYVNGVETGTPEEVSKVRWGPTYPKKTDAIDWGADSEALGTTAALEAIGKRLQDEFKVTFREGPVPLVNVEAGQFRPLVEHLKNKEGFSRLTTLHATDLHGRIGLSYIFEKRSEGLVIDVETTVPTENPELPTVSDLYSIANCQERKEYDLLGVRFIGHPNLDRIMTPDDWVGYPLRHDYVYPTSYHGASMY